MDDITSDFTIAINNAKAILELKDIVSMLYRNAKMSDIKTLYDNDTKDPKNECNFVTCMCIEDFYYFKYEPWTFDPSIRLNIASRPYEIYNCDGADFSIYIEKLKKQSLLQTNDAVQTVMLQCELWADNVEMTQKR